MRKKNSKDYRMRKYGSQIARISLILKPVTALTLLLKNYIVISAIKYRAQIARITQIFLSVSRTSLLIEPTYHLVLLLLSC